jgi:hypothetical protein
VRTRDGITGFVVSMARPWYTASTTRPEVTFLAPPTRTTSSDQQKFMFTVLNEHLQTDMGKTLVKNTLARDAQKIR